VSVTWDVVGGRTEITWLERGGPAVRAPEHRGFGTELIQRELKSLDGQLAFAYRPEGLEVRMSLPNEPGVAHRVRSPR
jgi:two-component sensor histidine kinase